MNTVGMADRLTVKINQDAQVYIDEHYPDFVWSTTIRNQIKTAFVDGGTASMNNLRIEMENGR